MVARLLTQTRHYAPDPRRGDYASDRPPCGADRASAPRHNIMYRDCVNRPRGPVTQSTLCISRCVLPRGEVSIRSDEAAAVVCARLGRTTPPPLRAPRTSRKVPAVRASEDVLVSPLAPPIAICGQNCRLKRFAWGRVGCGSQASPAPSPPFGQRAKSRRSAVVYAVGYSSHRPR